MHRWARALGCSPQAHFGLRPRVLGVPPAPQILAALFVTWAAASVSRFALCTSAGALGDWLRGSRCPLRQLRAGPQLPALRTPAPFGRPLATLGLRGERMSGFALRFHRLRAEPLFAPAALSEPKRLGGWLPAPQPLRGSPDGSPRALFGGSCYAPRVSPDVRVSNENHLRCDGSPVAPVTFRQTLTSRPPHADTCGRNNRHHRKKANEK